MKKDLTGLNSASFNNAAGNPTVKIDGDKGINAGDMKVTNVADGVADKDAVNVSQLKKTDDKAEANKVAIARNISLGGNTGSTMLKSLSTGDVKFNIKGANGLTTVAAGEDVTVQLDTDTKNKIDNAADKDLSNLNPAGEQKVKNLAAWKVVANNGTAEDVKGGDTVKFIDGDNIEITQAGKNFTIATKKDVTFDNITATQAITAPTVNATTGVVTPQVTGLTNRDWTPGQTTPVPGRAATEDQLKAVDNQVATNKQNIADNTTAIARKISLGSDDGNTAEKSLSTGDVKFNIKGANGITTAANGVDVTVKLDDDTKDQIDNAANKDLSNLTPDGKQQVKALAAWNVVANNGTAEKVQGGDTVKFIDGDNVSITQNGKEFTVATKKDVTFDNVTVNQKITAPEVSGLTNTTWVPGQTQPVSGRAATEDQLKKVDDQVDANKTAITKNAGDIATNKTNIDKNTTAIARKIFLNGNTGTTTKKSLSSDDVDFTIKGEDGITTTASGNDVTVKLDTATKNKIDNAADQDLSNLTPDGKKQVKDLAAWNVVANNGTAEKVLGGDTVKYINGDNIVITQSGKDFTFATKPDVTFNTVTANDTITAPKVKATTGVETPQVTGLTNKTWVPGQTQPVSGRAATEDQLKAVDDQVKANKDNITQNTGDIADNKQKIADNTTAINKNAGDIADNKQKIADNTTAINKNAGDIATNKANIDQNTTAIARKISLGSDDGNTDEKSLSTGDVKFNIKGENGITTAANGVDVTVKLDDATKDKIDNAANRDLSNLTPAGEQQVKDLAAWNVVANNGTAEKVQGGDTVKFIDGDNVSITQNGKEFTVATKKDVTFDNVTVNQKITAPEVSGLTNTTWVPGQTQPVSGRAATEDQLKKVDDQVDANKTAITKNAGDIATNKTNIDKNTTAIARKIFLNGNTGTTTKKSLSSDDVDFTIKGEDGITTTASGNDVTVKLDTATKNKIDNAADQDLSNLTPDGKKQVKDLAAWNVVANNGTAEKVLGGDTVKYINGDNIVITQSGKDFTFATKPDVTFNTVTANDTITAPKVKATTGVETPQVTGLTNKTWVPGQTQPVSGRAATEDQLKKVDDQVAANKDNINKNTTAIARKISLDGDTGSTTEKSLSTGDVKFKIKGEDGITTVAAGNDVTVKLDTDSKNKIDNAANKDLSNLTPAGEQQVKDLAAWKVVANNGTAEKVQGGDTVKFINGDNIEITQNGKDFTVATKKDVTFDTVTANDTITAPKVKATTGVETPEVTGLTNKTWVPGQTQPVSGRAATEDQLKAVDDQVAANKAMR